ncbi:1,4-dihydroxy-6-naphthoate synthase [Ferruginibacter sp. HRS2-29]|uniref:1,4-dihydroxy-6-naphthoate synthase n=1 Tax=Ferruginibacter sp. HRS2-29 TaxID=2487334 RepID=UPI0020CF345D|nr:1,4-dihydroxy-6-naphthoate synthase [Ferruginibacter sp. HRS2-29]MCP9750226.1 1,4-dihydroxy-6-naphthoate synthase [Ferruginibacter sp. HRS2-29]
MNNRIEIGFSPCPNDTFIFDALVNQKIDTEGLEFAAVLEDVQTLNQWAIARKLMVTKLSYGVLPLVAEKYNLLNSGSALGRGVGPLLIRNKKDEIRNKEDEIRNKKVEDFLIAIPGENTTAHLLFSLAYPTAVNKIFLRYDEIENFVLEGKGLGVIIHENRFTYQDKGLEKITDLGDYWETETGNSIPLGGIVIDRNIDPALQQKIDRLIRKSIEFAFSKYPELNDYIRLHSQEMSEDVMRKHIDLYVNEFSLDLGREGKKAVLKLMEVYHNIHPGVEIVTDNIFV